MHMVQPQLSSHEWIVVLVSFPGPNGITPIPGSIWTAIPFREPLRTGATLLYQKKKVKKEGSDHFISLSRCSWCHTAIANLLPVQPCQINVQLMPDRGRLGLFTTGQNERRFYFLEVVSNHHRNFHRNGKKALQFARQHGLNFRSQGGKICSELALMLLGEMYSPEVCKHTSQSRASPGHFPVRQLDGCSPLPVCLAGASLSPWPPMLDSTSGISLVHAVSQV